MINRGVRYIRRRLAPIPKPEKWAFLVGCYNSGTTLLHKLLGEHPKTGCLPNEGQFYTKELLLPKKAGYKRLWATKAELFQLNEHTGKSISANRVKRDWSFYYDDHTKPILLEKSPTNAGRMRWLQKHFDNAHFIGIIRNGYAVSEGIKRKTGHDVRLCAKQWAVSNQIMMEDFAKIDHKLIITYEALTENPKKILGQITDFLGIAALPDELIEQNFSVHEVNTKIENKNERSFQSLTNEEIQIINEEAAEMLQKLNYPLLERHA